MKWFETFPCVGVGMCFKHNNIYVIEDQCTRFCSKPGHSHRGNLSRHPMQQRKTTYHVNFQQVIWCGLQGSKGIKGSANWAHSFNGFWLSTIIIYSYKMLYLHSLKEVMATGEKNTDTLTCDLCLNPLFFSRHSPSQAVKLATYMQ